MNDDIKFMSRALELAHIAADIGEVPVGAVVVKNGEIIAEGINRRETQKNALCHAEIEAINAACQKLGGWRLVGCKLYVTLEPCPMCAGAIINSRLESVVFGASDKKCGSVGSIVNLFEFPFNHKPKIVGGVMEDECAEILKNFFKRLRIK
ncbi:MAG: tRNA adenosine(34) deaminase TadA [Oscillospiraceae bacterium]